MRGSSQVAPRTADREVLHLLHLLHLRPQRTRGRAPSTGGPAAAVLPVEDFPDYDPQRTCSPTAKKGTLAPAAWLQRTYRGSAQPTPIPAPTPTPPPVPQPPPTPDPQPTGTGSTGAGDRTAPLLELGRTEAVLTRVRAGQSRYTRYALRKGRRYRVTVHGVTRYGAAPSQVADAVCSWCPGRGWRPGLDPATQAEYGRLDLRVNGARPFGARCRTGRHLYRTILRPRRTGPLHLLLDQPNAVGGSLVVAVTRASYRIGAHHRRGRRCRPRQLLPRRRRARGDRAAGGPRRLQHPPAHHDPHAGDQPPPAPAGLGPHARGARQLRRAGGRRRPAHAAAGRADRPDRHAGPRVALASRRGGPRRAGIGPLDAHQDVLGLHVDGRSPSWRTSGGDRTCSSRHVYVATLTATHDGPLALGFLDADHADNSGAVKVHLRRR